MTRLLMFGFSLFVFLMPLSAMATGPMDAGDLDRLSGKWKLDWDRSEPFGPAMKALEVPWLLRQMAGIISVEMTFEVERPSCEACNASVQISSENPIKNTTRIVVLDGVSRPFTDALGNESMDRFSWSSESGLEMIRERILDSGKVVSKH